MTISTHLIIVIIVISSTVLYFYLNYTHIVLGKSFYRYIMAISLQIYFPPLAREQRQPFTVGCWCGDKFSTPQYNLLMWTSLRFVCFMIARIEVNFLNKMYLKCIFFPTKCSQLYIYIYIYNAFATLWSLAPSINNSTTCSRFNFGVN